MKIKCITLSSEMECNQYTPPSGRIYFFWHNRYTEVGDAEDIKFFLKQKKRFIPEKEIIPETPDTVYNEMKEDENETATAETKMEVGEKENEDFIKTLVAVKGVGEEIAEMIKLKYKNITGLEKAELKDLEKIPGLGKKRARKIFEELVTAKEIIKEK